MFWFGPFQVEHNMVGPGQAQAQAQAQAHKLVAYIGSKHKGIGRYANALLLLLLLLLY